MNPKIRALIWEELRTGGVIAAWCTVVGGLCLLVARLFDDSGGDWNYISPVALTLNLLPPLLTGLLLLYRTGNSGILTGGFSGRLLLLPVETWKLTGLALVLRAALLAVATAIALALCRGMFWGHGPAWVLVLLTPACYLWLQSLEWLRRPVPLAAVLGFVPIFATIGFTLTQSGSGRLALDEPFLPLSASLLLLIAAGLTSFVLANFAVRRTRRGRRVRVSLRLGLPEAVSVPGWRVHRGFRSPRWALLWHFLCRDGFVLPVFMFFFGAIALLGYGVWLHFAGKNTLSWLAMLDWGVWPVLALSAMFWGGTRGGAGIQRGIRPVLTEYLYPLSAAEMAVTRLWGYGIVLGSVWLVALVLSNLGFLLGDKALAGRIWLESLRLGESSVREFLASRLMLPGVILVGAWVLTAIRTRLVAWMLGMMVLYATVVGVAYVLVHEDPSIALIPPTAFAIGLVAALMAWTRLGCCKPWPIVGLWLVPAGLAACLGALSHRGAMEEHQRWLALALMVACSISAIFWAWRRGVMPTRHLIGCAVTALVTVLFVYPFGRWPFSGFDRASLLYATVAASLVVLPYPALLLDLHRRRHHDDTPLALVDHAQPRGWGLSPALRSTAQVALVLSVLFLAWLHWPAEPVYIGYLRAAGRPATATDLAARYASVTQEENGALAYLRVIRDKKRLSEPWYTLKSQKRSESDENAALYSTENNFPEALELQPDAPLWAPRWKVATEYRDMVSRPVNAMLSEVAEHGYSAYRYPIDLGSGAAVSLSHLSAVRDLARTQLFDAWMAAMEDRPEDAIKTIKSIGPLAESLREEPILISQLVRIAVHGILINATEQALNRTEFSEAQLSDLQQYLSTLLPPLSEHGMIAQGLIGERTFASIQPDMETLQDYNINMAAALLPRFLYTQDCTIALRGYAAMEQNKENRSTPLLEEIDRATNPQFVLLKIVLPGLDRARESEFRCRVSLDMAAAACAVERYRLAQGALPATLEALVPTFLDTVPLDPFRNDKGPVSFRVNDDGSYALYSWAQNRTDEQGVHLDPKEKKGNDWINGDWIFSVAPLSFRNGSQLTDTPPADDKDAGLTQPQISRRRDASS